MAESWRPPTFVPRDEVIAESNALLGAPDIPLVESEDVFRIATVGLDWDIGVMIYKPDDEHLIPLTNNGDRIGVFLLHGGSGDFRSMEGFARLIARKLGYKVVSMTYPGRLHLDAENRIWPGETIRADGSVRTPIWLADESIGREQYDVIEDVSMRSRYGTRVLAMARPGTRFHARMAGWPAAFEAGMKSACSRHLGDGYSILLHGHSTGGPFVSMLSQRVPNVMGVVAIEASPFGYIQEESRLYTGNVERRAAGVAEMTLDESRRQDPFDELSVRTWRDEARYAGPEAAVVEGASALMRLPELMEDVMASWDRVKVQANFKCEYPISRNVTSELRAAAIATARRLGLDDEATDSLIDRYVGMTRELAGPDVKPVPPTLFGITQASRDHPEEVYRDVILPLYEKMDPSPRTALTKFGAGMHEYAKAEADLALGVAPSVITGWDAALNHGFFD